jgi:hypothetical protein
MHVSTFLRAGRLGRVAVLLGLAASLSGCWLQAGFGAGRQGFNGGESTVTAANVANLERRWSASVDGATQEAVIFQGKAFVASSGGLAALTLASGAEQWSGNGGGHAPAVIDGQLRVASGGEDACHMLTVDPATGASTELAAFGPPLPGFAGGCSPTGDVLAVGTQALAPWSVFVGPVSAGPPGPCNRGQSLFLTGPGVSSVDTATSEVWDHNEAQGTCTNGNPPPPAPTIDASSSNGTTVLFPEALTVRALPIDCTVNLCPLSFTVDVSGSVGAGAHLVGPVVVLRNGDFAAAASDGHVVVVDGTSHAVEWTATVGAPLDQPLAADATSIFATGTDGKVVALPANGCGAATCGATWSATLASPASARPSIGGDVLYVGSDDGSVTAFAATGCGSATCSSLWTASTGSEITGAPAIFSGTVVVGSADGTVTAYSIPAT